MTKLLYCEDCHDIRSPHPTPLLPTWCRCERHAVWWVNPLTGILRIYDKESTWRDTTENWGGHNWSRKSNPHRAWVLGLHNGFLAFDGWHNTESIQKIIDDTPDTYIFRKIRSLILRVRPGESNDTDWADKLPNDDQHLV